MLRAAKDRFEAYSKYCWPRRERPVFAPSGPLVNCAVRPLWVDLTGSANPQEGSGICAKQRFCEGVRFGSLMQRLLHDEAACDRLFQRVVEAEVEIADKAGKSNRNER